MNNELHVWIYPPGAFTPKHCGTLDLIGGRRCLFSYSESWLNDRQAFELSPDLPLRAGAFEPEPGAKDKSFGSPEAPASKCFSNWN